MNKTHHHKNLLRTGEFGQQNANNLEGAPYPAAEEAILQNYHSSSETRSVRQLGLILKERKSCLHLSDGIRGSLSFRQRTVDGYSWETDLSY